MTRIVLVSGSLRRHSLNSALLATAQRVLDEHDGVRTSVLDPRSLPHFDHDLDVDGGPSPVAAARGLVGAADGLLISTPSYNGAPPGVLKNALDWLSRPEAGCVLAGKPVAVMSASTGFHGAAEAQEILRDVLDGAGADVLDHPVLAVARADQLPRRGRELADPALLAPLRAVADALLSAARPVPVERPETTPDSRTRGPATPAR
ncbi:chromate reductase [Streptomyces sp. B3I7]|uniref:NADPH-dependent FMN reductase n=1 Tax=unclassified Streptomyces TaxID=2593676 RepID=UPI002785F296|nr:MULTISPECIES: NADPH-dependent FMN reductase [unclassified Streptomyces]MDQ0791379.1 chromate reductase [Streptomyces sp. B3I8]MDQ0808900.1 chromate reductase [Streptomyces sp. B3I7]